MATKRWLNIVVDGNTTLQPYWSPIVSNYLEKIVRRFMQCNVQEEEAYLGLVLYNANSELDAGYDVQFINWTKDVNKYLETLSCIPFNGNDLNQCSMVEGLAEALRMYPKPSDTMTISEYYNAERHCILVASGNPVPGKMLVCLPMIRRGQVIGQRLQACKANFLEVAQLFGPLTVSLSVISPGSHSIFRAIFNLGNNVITLANAPTSNISTGQFTVLLSRNFQLAHDALQENRIVGLPSTTSLELINTTPSITLPIASHLQEDHNTSSSACEVSIGERISEVSKSVGLEVASSSQSQTHVYDDIIAEISGDKDIFAPNKRPKTFITLEEDTLGDLFEPVQLPFDDINDSLGQDQGVTTTTNTNISVEALDSFQSGLEAEIWDASHITSENQTSIIADMTPSSSKEVTISNVDLIPSSSSKEVTISIVDLISSSSKEVTISNADLIPSSSSEGLIIPNAVLAPSSSKEVTISNADLIPSSSKEITISNADLIPSSSKEVIIISNADLTPSSSKEVRFSNADLIPTSSSEELIITNAVLAPSSSKEVDNISNAVLAPSSSKEVYNISNCVLAPSSSKEVNISPQEVRVQAQAQAQATTSSPGEGSSTELLQGPRSNNRSVLNPPILNSENSSNNSASLLPQQQYPSNLWPAGPQQTWYHHPQGMMDTTTRLGTVNPWDPSQLSGGGGASYGTNFTFPHAMGNTHMQIQPYSSPSQLPLFPDASSSQCARGPMGNFSGQHPMGQQHFASWYQYQNQRNHMAAFGTLNTPAIGASTWVPPMPGMAPTCYPGQFLSPPSLNDLQDYVHTWEGSLAGKIQSNRLSVLKAKAFRKATTPLSLTLRWAARLEISHFIPQKAVNHTKSISCPIDYVIFHVLNLNNADLYKHLKSKNLCAKIDIPCQSIIISPSERECFFIGTVFPGDTLFIEPAV